MNTVGNLFDIAIFFFMTFSFSCQGALAVLAPARKISGTLLYLVVRNRVIGFVLDKANEPVPYRLYEWLMD